MRKLIMYDESCPMCRLYTKGMVAADTSGCLTRISSGELPNESVINRIDPQRARHEIPLIDLDGGETLYGVDTWIYAFGRHNQSLEQLLSLRWLRTALQKMYAFISYNRRIIITSAPGRWQLLDLQPDFHTGYRFAFILIIFSLTSALWLTGNASIWILLELIVCQLVLVRLYLLSQPSANILETILDYTGHLGMSLFLGTFVSTIGLTTGWPTLGLIGYALMIGQHFIRTYRLGLSPWLSVGFTALIFLLLL
jgi:predicted DCC family thiol-disulfide oxidoreductase YuxK